MESYISSFHLGYIRHRPLVAFRLPRSDSSVLPRGGLAEYLSQMQSGHRESGIILLAPGRKGLVYDSLRLFSSVLPHARRAESEVWRRL